MELLSPQLGRRNKSNKNPNDVDIARAYFIRGSMYGDTGEHQKALSDFDHAESDPDILPFVYRNRGNVYTYMNMCAKANYEFRRACEAGDEEACDMSCN